MKLLVISFALVAFFMYWTTKIFYHPEDFYEYDIQGRRNTFCSDGESKTLLDTIVCEDEFKKSHFIYLIFDGMTFDNFTELLTHVKLMRKLNTTTVTYRVENKDDIPVSAIMTQMLTGKDSNNFISYKLDSDHLVRQFSDAGIKMQYIGPKYPMHDLLGGETFSYENVQEIKENFPFEDICPMSYTTFIQTHLFKLPTEKNMIKNRTALLEYLDQYYTALLDIQRIDRCLRENQVYHDEKDQRISLLYFSPIARLYNLIFDQADDPLKIKLFYAIEKTIEYFMEWVDNNPDYLLIVSSTPSKVKNERVDKWQYEKLQEQIKEQLPWDVSDFQDNFSFNNEEEQKKDPAHQKTFNYTEHVVKRLAHIEKIKRTKKNFNINTIVDEKLNVSEVHTDTIPIDRGGGLLLIYHVNQKTSGNLLEPKPMRPVPKKRLEDLIREKNEREKMLNDSINAHTLKIPQYTIDTKDVAATISQYIKNVNIPLESQGYPYPIPIAHTYRIISQRMQEIQLKNYLLQHPRKYIVDEAFTDLYDSDIYRALYQASDVNDFYKLSDLEELITKYEMYIIKLKAVKQLLNHKSFDLDNYYMILAGLVLKFGLFVFVLLRMNNATLSDLYGKAIWIILFLIFFLTDDLIILSGKTELLEQMYKKSHYVYLSMLVLLVFIFGDFQLYTDFTKTSELWRKSNGFLDFIRLLYGNLFHQKNVYTAIKMRSMEKNRANKDEAATLQIEEGDDDFEGELENKRAKRSHNIVGLGYFIIFIAIVNYFLLQNEGLPHTKIYIAKLRDHPRSLNFLNYVIFSIYLVTNISAFRNIYYFKHKDYYIAKDRALMLYYGALIFLMAFYEFVLPQRFFQNSSLGRWTLKIIYSLIFYHIVFILINKATYKQYSKTFRNMPFVDKDIPELYYGLRLPFLAFIFFICQEYERFFLITIILPIYSMITNLFQRCKEEGREDKKLYFFIFLLLLRQTEIFYTILNRGFNLDLSFHVSFKTIGRDAEEHPTVTGFFSICHKYFIFIVAALYLLSLIGAIERDERQKVTTVRTKPVRGFEMTNLSMIMSIMVYMKVLFAALTFITFLFFDDRRSFVAVFVWCITKCMITLVYYVPVIITYLIDRVKLLLRLA